MNSTLCLTSRLGTLARALGFGRLLLCACVLVVSSAAQTQTQAQTQAQAHTAGHAGFGQNDGYDRWYELWLAGSQSGFVHETRTIEDELIHTRSTTQMAIKRAATTVTISIESEFVETLAGEIRWISVLQTMGAEPVLVKYIFENDSVRVTRTMPGATQGKAQGTTSESIVPRPEGIWLAPAAASRYVRQRLTSDADTIVVRTLDPSGSLRIVKTVREHFEPATVRVLGKQVAATRCTNTTTSNSTELHATEYLDNAAVVLKSETKLGGLAMVMIASDRTHAMVKADAAELMVSNFIVPDTRISLPRERTRATYILSIPEGKLSDFPQSTAQRVERLKDGSVRVVVDMQALKQAQPRLPAAFERSPYLASTLFADTNDPLIASLTHDALKTITRTSTKTPPDNARKAETLRRFVYAHITKKDLGVAFATASETARSREGDCTEHGVLLAALLREAQIPSRVAVGVVYIQSFAHKQGAFGYHMWTQALLDTPAGPAWIDLDATLDRKHSFDATHIAFGVSDLADASGISSLTGIVPLMGSLRIRVETFK